MDIEKRLFPAQIVLDPLQALRAVRRLLSIKRDKIPRKYADRQCPSYDVVILTVTAFACFRVKEKDRIIHRGLSFEIVSCPDVYIFQYGIIKGPPRHQTVLEFVQDLFLCHNY